MSDDLNSWIDFIESEDEWNDACEQDVIDDFMQTIGEIL